MYISLAHTLLLQEWLHFHSCRINHLPAIWTDSALSEPWNDAWGMKAVPANQSNIIRHNVRLTDGAAFFFIYFRKAFHIRVSCMVIPFSYFFHKCAPSLILLLAEGHIQLAVLKNENAITYNFMLTRLESSVN